MSIPELKIQSNFSLAGRIKSIGYALRGVVVFLKTTHAVWIHIFTTSFVVLLGVFLKISSIEWMFIVFACGFVIVTESINTAIEIDIDLTSPEYHPYARDTKDVAAGAVLIASLTAIIIGMIVFLPKVLLYVNI